MPRLQGRGSARATAAPWGRSPAASRACARAARDRRERRRLVIIAVLSPARSHPSARRRRSTPLAPERRRLARRARPRLTTRRSPRRSAPTPPTPRRPRRSPRRAAGAPASSGSGTCTRSTLSSTRSGASIYVSADDASLREYKLKNGELVHKASMPAQGDHIRVLFDRYIAGAAPRGRRAHPGDGHDRVGSRSGPARRRPDAGRHRGAAGRPRRWSRRRPTRSA